MRRFTDFLGTVPGLITAVVAIIVAAGGGYAAVTQVRAGAASPAPHRPHATPAGDLDPTAVPEPTDSGTSTDGPTPTGTPTDLASTGSYGRRYLSDTTPVSQDNYGGTIEATISHQLYPHSVQIGCVSSRYSNDSAEWTVGDATKFTATLGIADDAANASEAAADLSFTDQDKRSFGGTVTVSLGHPQQVSFAIPAGTVRLRVSCATRDMSGAQNSRSFYATLGDAGLER